MNSLCLMHDAIKLFSEIYPLCPVHIMSIGDIYSAISEEIERLSLEFQLGVIDD
jgi:hypothetical protein